MISLLSGPASLADTPANDTAKHWFGYLISSNPCEGCPHPEIDVISAEACMNLCSKFELCTGWTWNSMNRCYLKGNSKLAFRRVWPKDHITVSGQRNMRQRDRKRNFTTGTRVVLDIGVGNGQDTARYLEKGYSVIGLEPNPAALFMAQELKSVQHAMRTGQVRLLNYAVGVPGASMLPPSDFFINLHNEEWSSSDRNTACIQNPFGNSTVDDQHCMRIRVSRIGCDELIRDHIHYPSQLVALAKIDADGQEHNCLLGISQLAWEQRPRLLAVAVNKCFPHEVAVLMYKAGYTGFKIVDQQEAGESYSGSAAVGDGAVDIQTGVTAWRTAFQIMIHGRCPGEKSWCDLQAKREATLPVWRTDVQNSIDSVLELLERTWWHSISGTGDAYETPELAALTSSRC
mmetsp:Transcript_55904/g.92487  ORF Transcript_55904/g.92487 Transcript_55904/m.92487 type:complete len:402 (+) Transcript_55904:92-1297(+)